MGYRDAVALQSGVDDNMLALVDDHEHSQLSRKQKAALRFADAYLSGPVAVDDDLRAELTTHFTPDELGALLVREVARLSLVRKQNRDVLVEEARVVQLHDQRLCFCLRANDPEHRFVSHLALLRE